MDQTYLYPYSVEYAEQHGELSLWRASYLLNIDCKEAIEKSVRKHFDGSHLDNGCLNEVLQKYGYRRTGWVLANTIQQLEWRGRYSARNKTWANQFHIPPDELRNLSFVVTTYSAVLNSVVDQYREAYEALGLFDAGQCEPDSHSRLDYEGKVLVLSPDSMKESCWSQRNQLWYANNGTGCSPHAIGRSIRCTCLGNGEMTRWNRADFIGVLGDRYLPAWAVEKLAELKNAEQSQNSHSEMGEMTMN